MRTLAIDPTTGDSLVTAGRAQTCEGLAAVRQKLDIRLRFWAGSWFADTSIGIPYRQFMGVPGAEALAESLLRQAIQTCPGVVSLDTFSLVLTRRNARVSYTATTTDGPVVVTDFVAGAA